MAFYATSISSIHIPKGVEVIGSDCMCACASLRQVIFDPECKARLESGAFFESGLRSISIPSGIEVIGGSCFRKCVELSEVTFGDDSKLKKIGGYAFHETALKSVRIPATVDIIGECCFECCNKLEEAVFEAGSKSKIVRRKEVRMDRLNFDWDKYVMLRDEPVEGAVAIGAGAFPYLKCVKVGPGVKVEWDFGDDCRIESMGLPQEAT
jgi:hypothetical protein